MDQLAIAPDGDPVIAAQRQFQRARGGCEHLPRDVLRTHALREPNHLSLANARRMAPTAVAELGVTIESRLAARAMLGERGIERATAEDLAQVPVTRRDR